MKEKENVLTVRFGLIRACVLLQAKWTSGCCCCCCCCCYGVGIGMNLYINQHGRHSLHLNLLGLIRNREIVLFCLVDKKKQKKQTCYGAFQFCFLLSSHKGEGIVIHF